MYLLYGIYNSNKNTVCKSNRATQLLFEPSYHFLIVATIFFHRLFCFY